MGEAETALTSIHSLVRVYLELGQHVFTVLADVVGLPVAILVLVDLPLQLESVMDLYVEFLEEGEYFACCVTDQFVFTVFVYFLIGGLVEEDWFAIGKVHGTQEHVSLEEERLDLQRHVDAAQEQEHGQHGTQLLEEEHVIGL